MVVDPGVKQVPSAFSDSDANLNKRSLAGALLRYPGAGGDDAWAMVPAKTPMHGQTLNVSTDGSLTLERWDNDKRQAIIGWAPHIFKDCDPTHVGECPYKVGGLAVSIKPLPNPGGTLADVLVDFGAREADPQQMAIEQLLRAIGFVKHPGALDPSTDLRPWAGAPGTLPRATGIAAGLEPLLGDNQTTDLFDSFGSFGGPLSAVPKPISASKSSCL